MINNPSLDRYQFTPRKENKSRERKISLFFLFFTLILNGFFWLKANWSKWGQDFLKPLVIEVKSDFNKNKAATKEEVLEKIRNLTQDLMGVYGIYVYSFKSKEAYGLNEKEVFPAASLNKIPIMIMFWKAIEEGLLTEENQYRLQSEDIQDYGTGSMRYQEPGKIYTYRQLLRLSGKQSDNTAAYVMGKIIGLSKVQNFLEEIGLSQTSMEKNETTPEEMGKLWLWVEEGKIFKTDKVKNQFFSDLEQTDFEDRLPAGLPSGTLIAHKIGSAERAYHDCGLVFSSSPFVICVMSKEAAEAEALELMPKIAKIVWDFEVHK